MKNLDWIDNKTMEDDVQTYLNNRLIVAVVKDNEHDAKILCKLGANVNVRDVCSDEPIIWHAIKHKNSRMVKILLDYGVNTNVKNKEGYTPLFYSIHNHCHDMTGFFIEKIDVNTPDNKNRTVLHYAFLYKYPIGLVALLFKNDVNVNAVDKYGKTPLFYANKMNSSQELKNMLYDRGAHL